MRRFGCLVAILLSGFVSFSPDLASACSCRSETADEYVVYGALIFTGRVTEVMSLPRRKPRQSDSPRSSLNNAGERFARFEVLEAWKGKPGSDVTLSYAQQDGVNCGAWFTEGETVTVRAFGAASIGYGTSMCARNLRDLSPPYRTVLEAYRDRVRRGFALPSRASNGEALGDFGRFLVEHEDLEVALDFYRRWAGRHPVDTEPLLGLAGVRYRLGARIGGRYIHRALTSEARRQAAFDEFAEALRLYRSVLEQNPAHEEAGRGLTLALLQLGKAGEISPDHRDFSGLRLEGVTFAGGELPRASFREAEIQGADFSEAALAGSDFTAARVDRATFASADLAKADFTNLRSAYKADFGGSNLSGASFRGASLGGTVFDGAKLGKADFSGARLGGTSMRNLVLKGVDLSDANLGSADLSGTDFADSRLRGVNLAGARLQGADLSAAQLDEADFSYAWFDCATRWPQGFDPVAAGAIPAERTCAGRGAIGFDFKGRVLSQSVNFKGADFEGVSFAGATLKYTRLWYANLRNSDFRGARIDDASFSGSDLSGADFSGVDASEMHLDEETNVEGANFRGARLPYSFGAAQGTAEIFGATFSCWSKDPRHVVRNAAERGAIPAGRDCAGLDFALPNLAGADLSAAVLVGAHLSGAEIRSAGLRRADLTDADLRSADLRGADLRQAVLKRAKLSDANLTDADLRGALYSRRTTWPAGFDPRAAGAVATALININSGGITAPWVGRSFYKSYLPEGVADANGPDLPAADLAGGDLRAAWLKGSDLSGASLVSADLTAANLAGADLAGADLSGALLSDALLDSAVLREARYDRHTVWPTGFDPMAAGAELVDDE